VWPFRVAHRRNKLRGFSFQLPKQETIQGRQGRRVESIGIATLFSGPFSGLPSCRVKHSSVYAHPFKCHSVESFAINEETTRRRSPWSRCARRGRHGPPYPLP